MNGNRRAPSASDAEGALLFIAGYTTHDEIDRRIDAGVRKKIGGSAEREKTADRTRRANAILPSSLELFAQTRRSRAHDDGAPRYGA